MAAPLRRLLPLVSALAALAGCFKPAGSCEQTSDCAKGETCNGGVCVQGTNLGGGGSGGGQDPSSFTPVTWSALQGSPGTTFRVDAIGADGGTGDVVVAGSIEGTFSPWGISTGAFAAKLAGGTGAFGWSIPFPTFSHDRFRVAVLPGGDVLFAATIFDPTTIPSFSFTPPPEGALVVGRLPAGGGAALWARAVGSASASSTLVPVALSAWGTDLLVAGTGAGDFGCVSGGTGGATFAVALSGVDGACLWSRGFTTRSIADIEPRDSGDAAIAGVCAPTGASFDPGTGATCAKGLYVAALSGANGGTSWARFASGSGDVTAVRDVAVTPDGSVTVVGDATGALSFGGTTVDFGTASGSFAARFGPGGAPSSVVRPIEAPYASLPDAASFVRCAADRLGKVWIAGRYQGQPTLGGVRFTACRPPSCASASFLARLETDGRVSSFLPLRAAPLPDGSGFTDDLVLFATTGTLAHALRFTGSTSVGGTAWQSQAGDLGVLRIVP
jgi:hypothetical protein